MNEKIKNLILWSIIAIILISVFSNFGHPSRHSQKLAYSEFLTSVNQGEVSQVAIDNEVIQGSKRNGQSFVTYLPMQDQFLLSELIKKGVVVQGKAPHEESLLLHIFINWFPMFLLIAVWLFFMRQMQGGGGRGGPMSFGRSRARLLNGGEVKVTFDDLGGIDEARGEVEELVEFLKDPDKFHQLGGKIPRGVLLMGSPGTGKTLLAKAISGEAKVPFFSISGSEFVEMFVGVGASRVRDLFEQAKKQAPCIIFIDEIDSVGRHRGSGLGGGHDEREQTLNQLLVEMDGFEGKEGIIVMAATNRPDVLDRALLRPGRFDRQVVVPLPDIRGREKILEIHIKKLPIDQNVNARIIARGTPGFSGADLANLANEAAILAARNDRTKVTMHDFEQAQDKIMMGSERSMAMSDQEKKLTAYHEAGHAIVGRLMPGHDPIYKVTIIPRGRALGVTMFLPENDRYSYTKETLLSQIATLYGGRIAEILIFGPEKVTTGASNDIEKATKLAREMVTKWGFDDTLGPITYDRDSDEVFMGRSSAKPQEFSDKKAEAIDAAVSSIIHDCYQRAEKLLQENSDKLHAMANALIQYETIGKDQIDDIMENKVMRNPDGWENNIKETSADTKPENDSESSTIKTDPSDEKKPNSDPDET